MIRVTEYRGWRISVSDDGVKWRGRNDEDYVEGRSIASVKTKIDAARKKASDFKPYQAWWEDRGDRFIQVRVTSTVNDESGYGSLRGVGRLRVSRKGEAGNVLRSRVSAAEIYPVGWEPNDEVAEQVLSLMSSRERIGEEIAELIATMISVEERPDAQA